MVVYNKQTLLLKQRTGMCITVCTVLLKCGMTKQNQSEEGKFFFSSVVLDYEIYTICKATFLQKTSL